MSQPSRTLLRRRDAGIATIIAIMLISIVAVCLAALAALFAADVRRNAHELENAQLRQLLIAGESAARESLGKPAEKRVDVRLPEELASAGLSLSYESILTQDVNTSQIRVIVRGSSSRALSETLTYAREGDRFKLKSAELD